MSGAFQDFAFKKAGVQKRKPKNNGPSQAKAASAPNGGPPNAIPGPGVPERLGDEKSPLRLVIVGHNPSEEAWRRGHFYAHKSNRMWPILRETGIAPPSVRGAEDDVRMAPEAGVGFTDVGTGNPGTDSRLFGEAAFAVWGPSFLQRLQAHVARVNASIGCKCGACGAPSVVAFSGKKQFVDLVNSCRRSGSRKVQGGEVPVGQALPRSALPAGWPLPDSSEVWVMTSTSGASALSTEDRVRPWRLLAERIRGIPWPRSDAPTCTSSIAPTCT